jgi:hypothetical protein
MQARVLGTLKRPVYAQNLEININDLGSWVSEIHSGMYTRLVCNPVIHPLPFAYRPMQQPNGLFKNDADGFNNENSNSNSNFDDAPSSTLFATTVYHLARITGNKTFIAQAERTCAALFATNGTSTPLFPPPYSSSNSSPASASSAFVHATAGWLSPAVDPLNFDFISCSASG